MTIPIEGREVTLSLRQWSQALNGSNVTDSAGHLYQFGEMTAPEQQRLQILAAIEEKVLETYDYIPLIQNAEPHLLSIQAQYPVKDFHPVLGHGDFAYLRYRYTDPQWETYLQEQNGTLPY